MSDYIKREDATAVIRKTLGSLGNSVITEINSLSGYVADRPTGEWEVCKDDDGIYGVCSICGRDADFSHYGIPYKFCPNCGAKMLGEDGEEE